MRVVIARQAGVLRDRLRETVLGLGLECAAADCVSHEELPGRLSQAPADLVLVGLGADLADSLQAVARTYELTSAPVFAVGLSSNSADILQALRSGAREHLHESDVREELLVALNKLKQAGNVAPRWGKVVAVTGAQPGLGVTTITGNLGFALARYYPAKVVVAEMAASVPALALNLNITPTHDMEALVAAWDRLDSTLLRRALVNHPRHLSVLAQPPDQLQPVAMPPAAARNLTILLRSMFDFTIVDLGHHLDETRASVLALADKVIVVLRLDVPAVRLSQQFLRQLTDQGVATESVVLIVNRYGQRRQFSWKKAQQALGLSVAEWIPDDPARLNQAVNFGQPLVQFARSAAITRRFARLARQLNGQRR